MASSFHPSSPTDRADTAQANTDHADKRHFWHPFTQMKEYEARAPVMIEQASGVTLTDRDGKTYIDGIASWWVNLVGHRHPRLDAALKRQIDRFSHVSTATLTHEPAARLASELTEILPPGLTRTFYSDDGSTAVETALKMVFQAWRNRGQPQRTRFVSLQHGYHGDTLGAVSVGDVAIYHQTFKSLLFPVHHVTSPAPCIAPPGTSPDVWLETALTHVEQLFAQEGETLAAFILEPLVQAAAGMYVYSPVYLRRVRALCDRYDVPLIADEVAVGFGRTGKAFACEHAEISPDVICLSKALTGGYLPMGVTVATDALFDAFYGDYRDGKTFFHGHSYTGNPLGCALALEVLAILREEDLIAGLAPKIKALQEGFRSLGDLPHVGDVRGIGMIAALELYADPSSKTAFPLEARVGYRICQEALSRGLYVRPLGEVLYLLPPLSITVEEIERCIEIYRASIRAVLG